MRAIGFRTYGGPEVLEMVDIPEPVAGPGQVRIRTAASTVNPADLLFREGGLAAVVQQGEWPYISGLELSGIVDQVGPGSAFKTGEAVMAITSFIPFGRGAHAEYVVVDADSVAPLPEGATFAEAATLPMNGLTAQLVLDTLNLERGQPLGVTGPAGAIGGFITELAAIAGLEISALAAERDRQLVQGLGARRIFGDLPEYRNFHPQGIGALVDAAGLGVPAVDAVRDGGRVIALRVPSPQMSDAAASRRITITLVSVRQYQHDSKRLEKLRLQAASRLLTLRVASSYRPEQSAQAHRRLARGGVRGRLVIEWPKAAELPEALVV